MFCILNNRFHINPIINILKKNLVIYTYLNTMIMRLLAIVTASLISVGTVVAGRVPHETVLQALVSFFVPLEMSDHLFFLHEHS